MSAPAAPSAPDILSADFAADPYSAYRVMRDDHPLIWHEPTQSYVISRYMEDIAFADGAPPPERGVFTRAPSGLRLTFTPTGGPR